jgi:hypothetical protein
VRPGLKPETFLLLTPIERDLGLVVTVSNTSVRILPLFQDRSALRAVRRCAGVRNRWGPNIDGRLRGVLIFCGCYSGSREARAGSPCHQYSATIPFHILLSISFPQDSCICRTNKIIGFARQQRQALLVAPLTRQTLMPKCWGWSLVCIPTCLTHTSSRSTSKSKLDHRNCHRLSRTEGYHLSMSGFTDQLKIGIPFRMQGRTL